MDSAQQKIRIELVKLLYKQMGSGLLIEALAILSILYILYGIVNQTVLIVWVIFSLFVCVLYRPLIGLSFKHSAFNQDKEHHKLSLWLNLYMIGTFLSGITWGALAYFILVEGNLLRQLYEIFLLAGASGVGNSIYSPYRRVFISFIIPTLLPLSIGFFLQGGIFILLGILSLGYMLLMMKTSFYTNYLLWTSLKLRFENNDLIEDLEKRTKELEKTLSLFKATLDSTTDGILAVDSTRNVESHNQKFIDLWGLGNLSFIGKKSQLIANMVCHQLKDPEAFVNKINEVYKNSEGETFDELNLADGRIIERYSYPQRIGKQAVGRVWSFRDVTHRKQLEDRLLHQACHDSLTKLPNRILLLEKLTEFIETAKQNNTLLAILFIDVDHFKFINDTMGHPFGDKILIRIAKRLVSCINKTSIATRESGDEFVIILNDLHSEVEALMIAKKCLNKIRKPFLINGHNCTATISIGINFFPKDGNDPEALIRNADIAMYHAKELGRNNYQCFTNDLKDKMLNRSIIESKLRKAIENGELFLVYQPIASLKTGCITGVEALIRWNHPDFGLLSPNDFIPIAEECGMIVQIGEWVIHQACLQGKQWLDMGITPLQLSINLSGRQFKQPNFLEQVYGILEQTGFDPHHLSFELTESIIMDDFERNIGILNKMKAMGITILIDDFGVGYSSLNYLKRLPVDKLKIDRSFIQDIPNHADDIAIVNAIIALGHSLNLKIVAEGVENKEHLQFLHEHHCDEMQGYYLARPLNEVTCTSMLTSKTINLYK